MVVKEDPAVTLKRQPITVEPSSCAFGADKPLEASKRQSIWAFPDCLSEHKAIERSALQMPWLVWPCPDG